jgi:hypothetical protein
METQSTGASLRGWKRHYAGADVVEINGHTIFNALDLDLACAHVLDEFLSAPSPHISLTLAPERAENLRHTDVPPWMQLDHFFPGIRILHEMGGCITFAGMDLRDELVSAIRSTPGDIELPPDIANPMGLHDTSKYEEGTQP